jgi:long-chain acyl-CoA synthetase
MSLAARELLEQPFGTLSALVRAHARERPGHVAVRHDERHLEFRGFDELVDRIAAALLRDGAVPGDTIAICAATSIEYVALYVGGLRAGLAVAPLPPSATAASLSAMVADSGARWLFVDAAAAAALAGAPALASPALRVVGLSPAAGTVGLSAWLEPAGATPRPVEVSPSAPFNIIYSSGTTGTPKGIVQSHAMRWRHIERAAVYGYGPDTVTLVATPLYSNTTLVSVLPTLAQGGTSVLMTKFDPAAYLALAERHRATHTMLVPVQYRRLMALPDFGRYDLSSFRMKQCTSAPFAAALKADILARWPGGLVEIYGMTEGGGTFILAAHLHPDKLHTVGRAAPGHDIRLIDDEGREVPPGAIGEIAGHSPAMMNGYHRLPDKTRDAEWYDATGKRFIRSGDIGRLDEDGFLILLDRKKDMIISGGFNVYPSDLESVLASHPAVAEVAVVGVPSARWGETPVAFVVPAAAGAASAAELLEFANQRLGKTQRLAAVELVDRLPRSSIGKVLKRELRASYGDRFGS